MKKSKVEHGKYPIDRPCSACSAGDDEMEYHDHDAPFRNGYGPDMSKVEQGEPQTIRERTKVWFASLGYKWKSPANVRWCDIGGWIEEFIYEQRPESQPAPEMDEGKWLEEYAVSQGHSTRDVTAQDVETLKAFRLWLRAHDARVQPVETKLQKTYREYVAGKGTYSAYKQAVDEAAASASQQSSVAGTERLERINELLEMLRGCAMQGRAQSYVQEIRELLAESALKESSR